MKPFAFARPADAPRGRWLPERVDLAADWRAAFGGGSCGRACRVSSRGFMTP